MRVLLFSLLVATSLVSTSCGEGNANDCACTVTINGETLNLGCGEAGCIGGYGFGCDNDEVQALGRCNRDDGGACVMPGDVCVPSMSTCCSPSDGGPVAPTCDPTSRRCCAASGTSCTSSADCCSGHACEMSSDGLRCSN